MKKLSAVLILIFALFLVGCSSDTADPPVTESSDTESAPKEPIDRKRAVELASEHWGVKSGEVDEVTGFKMNIFVDESPTPESNRYRIVLRWLVDGHYSTVEEIFVNADSGEISYPFEADF